MPITLPSISRRQFLATSAATGLGLILGPDLLRGEETSTDPHRFALLSDTHIAADPKAHDRGVVMAENLKRVSNEVVTLAPKPAAVLVNGDCAYHTGETADYETFLGLIRPMREHGLPMHLTLGNHDDRDRFWATLPQSEEHAKPLPHRQIVVSEAPRANWIMLDSLDKTNHTPGLLGPKQIDWLRSALDERKDKPAIVLVHHQPDQRKLASGLLDTKALLDVVLPRKQVKALLYGHTHEWDVTRRDELHCINLPTVAYVFAKGQPSGWVDCNLREDGMSIELRCIDTSHPKHGEKHDLIWRS